MTSLDTIPSSLPILVLPNDILFTGSQLTIALPRTFTTSISRIVKNVTGNHNHSGNGGPEAPLVVAVPTVLFNKVATYRSIGDIKLFDWGCGQSSLLRLLGIH